MDTKKELKILFWMIVVFVAVFFMPLGSERFMTLSMQPLTLPNGMRRNTSCYACFPPFSLQRNRRVRQSRFGS